MDTIKGVLLSDFIRFDKGGYRTHRLGFKNLKQAQMTPEGATRAPWQPHNPQAAENMSAEGATPIHPCQKLIPKSIDSHQGSPSTHE